MTLGRTHCLTITYRVEEEQAQKVAEAVRGMGSEVLVQQADAREGDAAERVVRATLAAFGRIDVLVNNAGVTRDGLLLRMSEDDWRTLIETDLSSVYRFSRAALRPMIKQRSGRIINISSIAGLIGNAGQANYSAAKAGVIGFTKALAREVGSRGITVNAVAPGFIETEMTSVLRDNVRNDALAQVPLGRYGRAEEVAKLVDFLAGADASYITGQVIAIDGGLTMV